MRYLSLIVITFFHINSSAQEISHQSTETVWEVVEKRISTWKENDVTNQMKIFHPDFRRWTSGKEGLINKDHIAKSMQTNNDPNISIKDIKINREELLFYNNGNLAVAHYWIAELLEWIGDDYEDEEINMTKGDIITEKLRISDYYVRNGKEWLYIGGSIQPINE